jgi:hypothetical protein
MKIKTSALTGAALDWAVAQAEGRTVYQSKSGRFMTANYGEFNHRHGTPWFIPSTDWELGGPIIEREKIELTKGNPLYFPEGNENGDYYEVLWIATLIGRVSISEEQGQTPLIAAMRCYVASKLGDEVEVPDELA